jgi:hypothetical protein
VQSIIHWRLLGESTPYYENCLKNRHGRVSVCAAAIPPLDSVKNVSIISMNHRFFMFSAKLPFQEFRTTCNFGMVSLPEIAVSRCRPFGANLGPLLGRRPSKLFVSNDNLNPTWSPQTATVVDFELSKPHASLAFNNTQEFCQHCLRRVHAGACQAYLDDALALGAIIAIKTMEMGTKSPIKPLKKALRCGRARIDSDSQAGRTG